VYSPCKHVNRLYQTLCTLSPHVTLVHTVPEYRVQTTNDTPRQYPPIPPPLPPSPSTHIHCHPRNPESSVGNRRGRYYMRARARPPLWGSPPPRRTAGNGVFQRESRKSPALRTLESHGSTVGGCGLRLQGLVFGVRRAWKGRLACANFARIDKFGCVDAWLCDSNAVRSEMAYGGQSRESAQGRWGVPAMCLAAPSIQDSAYQLLG